MNGGALSRAVRGDSTMKFLRGLLLAATLIFVSVPASATNKNHQKAQAATFVLYGRSVSRGIDHKELCTAFAYKKAPDGYYLLTAGHCFIGTNAPVDVTYVVAQGQIVSDPKNLQPVEVLNAVDDGKMDVAELHLKTDNKYSILKLDENPTKIDDEVFYVGYPEMVVQAVYMGRVSSEIISKSCDEGEGDLCTGRFLVQTGGGPGASGSPIINEHTGRVVGILEGHVFENGVVVVPALAIDDYYAKVGHNQIKNASSESEVVQ